MSFSLTAAHRRITNQMQFMLVEHMNFWAKLNLFVINEKKMAQIMLLREHRDPKTSFHTHKQNFSPNACPKLVKTTVVGLI